MCLLSTKTFYDQIRLQKRRVKLSLDVHFVSNYTFTFLPMTSLALFFVFNKKKLLNVKSVLK